MHNLNYNHLYYFWMVVKQGSVAKAAEALHLTGQTVTGQIKLLESRLHGPLLEKSGRSVKATELGQLVFRYADKMFNLSYEMLDLIQYGSQYNQTLEVGIADSLSKEQVSKILLRCQQEENRFPIHCYESSHKELMARLRDHKLDMILTDCAGSSLKYPEILSKKIGTTAIGFFSMQSAPTLEQAFTEQPLLLPSRKTSLGQSLVVWLSDRAISANILGEFDDAAMMHAYGLEGQGIFVAPMIHQRSLLDRGCFLLERCNELTEDYHLIFAERMIQHPAVKALLSQSFNDLFE